MNHTLLGIIAYWVLSAVVSGMPAPTMQSGLSYRWAYQSLHILAGDLSAFFEKEKP